MEAPNRSRPQQAAPIDPLSLSLQGRGETDRSKPQQLLLPYKQEVAGSSPRLVRSRARAKNAVHATLRRNLKRGTPMADLFGAKGRSRLARLALPAHERRIVESCLREIDFLSQEIAALEAELAQLALSSEEVKRLMTVPGVSLVSAATFAAVVGDIHRFETPKKLVGYVGLDPKVRQSGEQAARHGRARFDGIALSCLPGSLW